MLISYELWSVLGLFSVVLFSPAAQMLRLFSSSGFNYAPSSLQECGGGFGDPCSAVNLVRVTLYMRANACL